MHIPNVVAQRDNKRRENAGTRDVGARTRFSPLASVGGTDTGAPTAGTTEDSPSIECLLLTQLISFSAKTLAAREN